MKRHCRQYKYRVSPTPFPSIHLFTCCLASLQPFITQLNITVVTKMASISWAFQPYSFGPDARKTKAYMDLVYRRMPKNGGSRELVAHWLYHLRATSFFKWHFFCLQLIQNNFNNVTLNFKLTSNFLVLHLEENAKRTRFKTQFSLEWVFELKLKYLEDKLSHTSSSMCLHIHLSFHEFTGTAAPTVPGMSLSAWYPHSEFSQARYYFNTHFHKMNEGCFPPFLISHFATLSFFPQPHPSIWKILTQYYTDIMRPLTAQLK